MQLIKHRIFERIKPQKVSVDYKLYPPKKGKKKKGGKGKRKAKDTKSPTLRLNDKDEKNMTKEDLEVLCTNLKRECDREREERNYFQLERDKINTFWEITKRQFDEKKAELRNKDREMEDAEERHQREIKVYKQKIRHLIFEHQNTIAELRAQSTTALTLSETQYRENELNLRIDKRSLKVENKEQHQANEELTKHLKRSYEEELNQLRLDFERRISEIERKYQEKMHVQREEMDLRRKTELHEVEERKNTHINELMKQHEKAFSDIKNYYNDITLNNLALINHLKEQVETMKKKEDRLEKQMAEVMAENKKLVEPLKQAEEENNELKRLLANYEKDKNSLKYAKARIKILEKDHKQLDWEHEILEQRFEQVQKERDDLYDKFVKAIREVQQKSGLKNILLERKLNALGDTLEKKDAQLNEVLSASNLDPNALSVVTRKLEDVLDSKNNAIKDLQYELARVCKAHNDLLTTYEIKLKQYGIPLEELGFKPLQSFIGNQELGKGPAGLVSAPT